MVLLDNQAILDALLLKADQFSDSLRKAGWSSEEVSDALGFDFLLEKERKPVKKLVPEIVERLGKLAQSERRGGVAVGGGRGGWAMGWGGVGWGGGSSSDSKVRRDFFFWAREKVGW